MATLDPATASFLDAQRVGHLATADSAGVPHVVPVCFARIGETVYVALDEKPKRAAPSELKRVRNVLANPRAALVADVYDEDWSRLGFALLHCRGRVLNGGDELQGAVAALREKYPQYRQMALEDRPLIALDVENATVWGTARARTTG